MEVYFRNANKLTFEMVDKWNIHLGKNNVRLIGLGTDMALDKILEGFPRFYVSFCGLEQAGTLAFSIQHCNHLLDVLQLRASHKSK